MLILICMWLGVKTTISQLPFFNVRIFIQLILFFCSNLLLSFCSFHFLSVPLVLSTMVVYFKGMAVIRINGFYGCYPEPHNFSMFFLKVSYSFIFQVTAYGQGHLIFAPTTVLDDTVRNCMIIFSVISNCRSERLLRSPH